MAKSYAQQPKSDRDQPTIVFPTYFYKEFTMLSEKPKLKLIQKKKGNRLQDQYPNLAKEIGLKETLVLQQVHYWISKPKNKNVRSGKVWVYKTYTEWQKEFECLSIPLSIPTIKRKILKLEKIGALISSNRFNRILSDRTKWYSIDYDKLRCLEKGTWDQIDLMNGSKRSHGGIKLIHSNQ